MVARGRGKKTAAAAASEAVANGDVILEDVGTTNVVAVEPATAKKGRARGSKREAAEEEIPVVEEAVKIPKKTTKTARATKGSKKPSKAAVEDTADVEDETKEDDVPAVVQKPAVAEKKTSSRKQKADKPEIEGDEVAPPVLKKQKTKTKAAQKETVDSAGVPEDPASVTDSASEQTQTSSVNIRLTCPQRLICLEAFYKNKSSYKLALNEIRSRLGTTRVPSEQYVLDLIKQFKETGSILQ